MRNAIEKDAIQKLKQQGKTVYSISRINSFNECKYGYDITYNQKDRGENNCYGVAGTAFHDWLEDIFNKKIDSNELPKLLRGLLIGLEMDNMSFPSEKIKQNWMNDMIHFVEHFEPLDNEGITEKLVVYQIEDIYMQGYIDLIIRDNNKDFIILDWKTSSLFTGADLTKAGRQLLIYKDALEQSTGEKVSKVGWYMIKYCQVIYEDKVRISSRRNVVKDNQSKILKELKKIHDDMTAHIILDEALITNVIPESVENLFEIRPHIQIYDANEDNMQEARDYILNTVKNIEIEKDFNPKSGNIKNDFFCKFLCSHRNTCIHKK